MQRQKIFLQFFLGVLLAMVLGVFVPAAWAQGGASARNEAEWESHDSAVLQDGVLATTTGSTNLRDKPGSGAVIGWVPNGKTVPVLGRDDHAMWILVAYGDKRGWIARWWTIISGDLNAVPVTDQTGGADGQEVAPSAAPSQPSGATTAIARTTMNIRQGPGVSYKILGQLPGGTKTLVLGRNTANSWLFVEYDGIRGWVARWLYRIEGDLANVPLTNEDGNVAQAPSQQAQPDQSYTAHLSGVGSQLLGIYWRGQQIGNRANAFSKVGDCETASPAFLRPIASNHYNLGQYMYLQDAVDFFVGSDSFGHVGQASNNAFTSSIILNPVWANPSICHPGETPLACEYRTHQPAVALISIRTGTDAEPGSSYHRELRTIVQYSINQGVIPVLATTPYWGPDHPPTDSLNETIRTVAREYNVPLWDFWITAEALPGRGVNSSFHLTSPEAWWAMYLTPDFMDYGVVHYNLEALEVLDAVMHQVIRP
jgi:uncharacterized protein YgiM (DUF1202 family)